MATWKKKFKPKKIEKNNMDPIYHNAHTSYTCPTRSSAACSRICVGKNIMSWSVVCLFFLLLMLTPALQTVTRLSSGRLMYMLILEIYLLLLHFPLTSELKSEIHLYADDVVLTTSYKAKDTVQAFPYHFGQQLGLCHSI